MKDLKIFATQVEQEALDQIEQLTAETGIPKAMIDMLIWHFCADGYGEVCTAMPHCGKCPLNGVCSFDKTHKKDASE